MRLPQDIANLLAHCIKNLIWYKDSIISFLEECGVPSNIIIQVKRQKDIPTLKLVPMVFEQLYTKSDKGFQIARTMLTKIYYWKDIHSVPPDRKDEAIASLRELQKAYRIYIAQEQYESEKRTQADRENRLLIKTLDHKKLQDFRDRCDKIY